MQQRALGRSGLMVSSLGLGTMTWGRETDENDAAAQLTTFHDAGGTLLDTSPSYTGGASERIVGRLLRDVVNRAEIVLATDTGRGSNSHPIAKSGGRGQMLADLDASLKRLNTDYLDLWQVNSWDSTVPIEEVLAALDFAVTSGRVRYVGVANFCGWQLGQVAAWQRALHKAPIIANQMEYSLVERGIEREVVPACLENGVGILAWSPLGRGVLTGKYRHTMPADSRGVSPQRQQFVGHYLTDEASRVVEAVNTAADGLSTSPLAVALAWVRDRPGVVAPIVGARNCDQLKESLASDALSLPAKISDALNDISATRFGYPELAPDSH